MILGSIIGLGGGIIQDVISYYKDKKQREMDIKEWKQKLEFEFEMEANKSKLGIKTLNKNIDLENSRQLNLATINAGVKQKTKLEAVKNEGLWFDAISKATAYLVSDSFFAQIANFIIATTRPIISYLFLFFICYIYKTQVQIQPQWLDKFVMAVLLQMEVITSFWFYRRGSDRVSQVTNNSSSNAGNFRNVNSAFANKK